MKLCEKAPFNTKDKDGKEVKNEKNICLTHHERLDGNTGMVMVSAAIREIEGNDKKSMMVMVPLGMALPPGLRAAVYTKEQWAQAAKNEKIDEKTLKPIALKYSLCHAAGCTAEVEATAEIVEQMKTGGGIMVIAMNARRPADRLPGAARRFRRGVRRQAGRQQGIRQGARSAHGADPRASAGCGREVQGRADEEPAAAAAGRRRRGTGSSGRQEVSARRKTRTTRKPLGRTAGRFFVERTFRV